jgi:hypothetical protein
MKKILMSVSLFLMGRLMASTPPQLPGQEDGVLAAIVAESQETLLACFNAGLAKGSFIEMQSVFARGYQVLGGDLQKVNQRWARRMGALFPILQSCSMGSLADDASIDYISELIEENNAQFGAIEELVSNALQAAATTG